MISLDARETVKEQREFFRAKKAEAEYAKKLRSVAHQCGNIARTFGPDQVAEAEAMLRRYGEMLKPWARITARRMLADVSRRDTAAWKRLSVGMSRALHEEIVSAPTGAMLAQLLEEQVVLITSLPVVAAARVHEFVVKGMEGAVRADEVASAIMRTGKVTQARANLIARTEVARAASGLLQSRAEYVGSEGYIWRTAEDRDVRRSHRKMAGRFVRWDTPPLLDNLTGHAGQLPNCRCYPEPVIPEEK